MSSENLHVVLCYYQLQLQLDRFTELNATYRNRYSASNRQIQKLLDEKAELEGHVQEKPPSDVVQFRKKRAQDGDNDGAVKVLFN